MNYITWIKLTATCIMQTCMLCTGQNVVGKTDHEAVLQLTGLVSGHYVFLLEVTDDAGQKSTSTASILVKPGLLLILLFLVILLQSFRYICTLSVCLSVCLSVADRSL